MKKGFLLLVTLLMVLTITVGCEKKETNTNNNSNTSNNNENQKKDEEKSFEDYAKEAVLEKLQEMYGENTEEIVIEKFKVYTLEEMKQLDELKEYANEGKYAFEVSYKLLAKENIDKNVLTVPNGEINGNWITDKSNIGLLSNTAKGTLYVINIGTGW